MTLPDASSDDAILRETAARWIVRRDRGLSASESIEYELWLAADPRHAEAIRSAGGAWSRLDRIPEGLAQATLEAATQRRRFWRRSLTFGALAAAAVVALAIRIHWPIAQPTSSPPVRTATTLLAAGPRMLTLGDGTSACLNTNSELIEQFTASERRVLLTHGEAHFTVTKDASRPFVVVAGTLQVRAVGTAFNVNLTSHQVEVLVTEGKVQLATTPADASSSAPSAEATPLLQAGQRAIVSEPASRGPRNEPAIVITQVNEAAIAQTLAWQDDLIRLGGATLAEIVTVFQRRSGHRIVLADPALAALRIGGRFRADDVEGFANLLATAYGIDMHRADDGSFVLQKRKVDSR